MDGAHGAQRCAQDKGAPVHGANQRPGDAGDGLRVGGVVGVGQTLRGIEHGLLAPGKRTAPDARLRRCFQPVQPHFIAVVAEIFAHRQRSRGEHPGAAVRREMGMETLRDGKRRSAQTQRARKAFAPAHVFTRLRRLPARQARAQIFAARKARRQPFGTFRLRFERLHEGSKLRFQRFQRLGKTFRGEEFLFGKTPALFVKQDAQIAGRLFQLAGDIDQLTAGSAGHGRLGAGIFCQFHQLRAGKAFAKKLAGNRAQLMRLIKDHRLTIRQQLAHAAAAQGKVGKKQMVIDHYHFRLPRPLARLGNKALFQIRALLPQTVFARGNRRAPRR